MRQSIPAIGFACIVCWNPADAIEQPILDRLVEIAKQGCLIGTEFQFKADISGNVEFRNPLKPGADGHAAVNVRNSPGATAIFDQQLRLAADNKIRDCMKPYVDQIFTAILKP
jgi:hypothetical protein